MSKVPLIKVNKTCDCIDTFFETHSTTPFYFHRKSIARNIQKKQWISYIGISMAQSRIDSHYECMGNAIVEAKIWEESLCQTSQIYFVFPLRYSIDMYVCDSSDLLKTDNGRILVLYTLSNNLWNLSTELCFSIRVKISIRSIL